MILDEWNGYPESFSFSQALEILGNICSFEQLFYRIKSLSAPVDLFMTQAFFLRRTVSPPVISNDPSIRRF